MRTTLPWTSLVAVLLASACIESGGLATGPVPQHDVRLDERVTLAIGEEAVVASASLRVLFMEVVEDSRCPTQVTCVWEGRARVSLLVTQAGAEHAVVLHAPPGSPRAVEVGGYRVEVQDLLPVPETSEGVEADRYRLVLKAMPAS